jgi:hypothetical protein
MEAHVHGFDLVFRWPGMFESLIGRCIYLDDQGHVATAGNITDDEHFKQLLAQSNPEVDPTSTTTEQHENLTAAFTTGAMEVRALTEEEYSE